jgi:hypothetical protein
MDNFFQIKFQETRKKSSKRVRRVVNRFFNPMNSSESSSEDEGKNKNSNASSNKKDGDSQASSGKGKGKKLTGPRVPRGIPRGRGRGSSRGRRHTASDIVCTAEAENDESTGRDLNDRSIMPNDTILRDNDKGTKEGRGSSLVNRKHKEEGRKVEKESIVGKGRGKVITQEFQLQQKGYIINKNNYYVRDPRETDDIVQSDHNINREKLSSNVGNNDNNVSMLGFMQRHNVNNQRYKIPKQKFATNGEESGSSGLGNVNDDSSTSSDTDSEENRSMWSSSGTIPLTNTNGGRSVGRKRTTGRGRGSTNKRYRIENAKEEMKNRKK